MRRLAPALALSVALSLALTWPAATPAQDLILPQPDLQTLRDCDACPELVILPDGLLISRAPVTVDEFAAFVAATGWQHQGWGCRWQHRDFPQAGDHPVTCMSYDAATAYAAWLAGQTGLPYRLPTVEEMRSAILGFETTNYWWGESAGQNRANCTGCGTPADGMGTTPVGTFAPNPFNLLDAVGNVWIWTTDCTSAECTERQLIGGGWSSPPSDLRVAKTIFNAPGVPFNSYGLRVVREAE